MSDLSSAVARLEAVAARLEKIAASGPVAAGQTASASDSGGLLHTESLLLSKSVNKYKRNHQ